MVLKNYIRKYRITAIIMLMALFFSCEESPLTLGFCATCLSQEPEKGDLDIKLKKKYTDQSVRIRIYEGNLEDSVMLSTWLTRETETIRSVPLNKTYTVTASYYVNGSVYVAVNSVLPRVRYDETSCEAPCYYIYDNSVNLRLKYTR
jgi:hypothetical protein